MINTSDHPVTVVKNGTEYRLDTLAYNISTKSGIGGSMAPLRGASAQVPGRTGSLWTPGRKRDEGVALLSMWAQSTDNDGVEAIDPYLQWRDNMDLLLWIFDTSNAQVELREYLQKVPIGTSLAGKPYRRAMIEVRNAIDPEIFGRVFGEFKVSCVLNDTYWEDYIQQTWTSPIGASAVATHQMNFFAGMTAPIEDATITVFGRANGPTLTDPVSGHQIVLGTDIPAASSWVFDCKTWSSKIGANSVTANTTSKGKFAPRLFGISAEGAAAPRIQLAASNTDANTKITVTARRKFH